MENPKPRRRRSHQARKSISPHAMTRRSDTSNPNKSRNNDTSTSMTNDESCNSVKQPTSKSPHKMTKRSDTEKQKRPAISPTAVNSKTTKKRKIKRK